MKAFALLPALTFAAWNTAAAITHRATADIIRADLVHPIGEEPITDPTADMADTNEWARV
jgi:hypothetical protein